ncbi:MAG: glycosyltransferase family 4 protein [Leptolyngbyaceae bacterium]|nr:glycosyltransferase family 4 protein [Leptolyngbyaceae bacterium]
MKISLIVSDLSSRGAGRWGGAVRPFLLTQALQHLGHTVEIVGFDDSPSSSFAVPQVKTHVLPARGYPGFVSSACQLLRQLDGDVVYAYKLKPSSFGLGLLYQLATRKPLFLDIDDWELSWHGGDRLTYRPSLKQLARDVLRHNGGLRQPDHPLYLKWIEPFTRNAAQITTHTQFLQQRFGGVYVPNGKDVLAFDPSQYDAVQSREKFGLIPYRILMFPGAPRPYKGLEDILAALDLLNEPDLRLVIVGGSPYDDYDQQLIQQWGRWIIQLPKFSYDRMPEVVSAAHVIVVPQRDVSAAKAQFPLKLTDGMAMAKPILATSVGDIPTILGSTGYLVAPSHVHQMAETIQHIFEDFDQAQHRGALARQRCVDHYSIHSMATRLEPLLSK